LNTPPMCVVCLFLCHVYFTTTHCDTLQHTATHCNAPAHHLQQRVVCSAFDSTYNTLQHTATHCNTLQHAAAHCNTLQHTPKHSKTLQHTCYRAWCAVHVTTRDLGVAMMYNTMQHTATHCNTLQHTATHRQLRVVCSACDSTISWGGNDV